jgi:hypothetical protein
MKGISWTSLHHGILNKICRWFFSTICSTQENKKITTNKLGMRTTFQCFLNQEFFFGSRVAVVSRDSSCWSIGSYVPFLQGSHMQKQYCKRTTLCSKSGTIKELLYAPDPEKCTKGMLSDQPRLSRVTSMVLLCCWGRSHSKIWCPLGLTLRCMSYGRGMLRILLQRIL